MDGADHGAHDEQPGEDEDAGGGAADVLDDGRGKGLADGEGGGDEGRVGEDEGEPGHAEVEAAAGTNAGPVGADRDEEEPEGETVWDGQ